MNPSSIPTFSVAHFDEMDEHDCPPNLAMSGHELYILFQAMDLFCRQKPVHFDAAPRRHEARKVLLLLHSALEHYKDQWSFILEEYKLPNPEQDWEKHYRALADLIAPHAGSVEKTMETARNILLQLNAMIDSRAYWKGRAEKQNPQNPDYSPDPLSS